MAISNKERVFCRILDCGTSDLDMLEDIEYDIDDIIENLKENNDLCINSIFREVFYQAIEDLVTVISDNKENAISEAESELENMREIADEEGEKVDELPEYKDLNEDLSLLHGLDPENDSSYYLNCLDTHICLKHLDVYRRFFGTQIEEIENNMGFTFEDWLVYWLKQILLQKISVNNPDDERMENALIIAIAEALREVKKDE